MKKKARNGLKIFKLEFQVPGHNTFSKAPGWHGSLRSMDTLWQLGFSGPNPQSYWGTHWNRCGAPGLQAPLKHLIPIFSKDVSF